MKSPTQHYEEEGIFPQRDTKHLILFCKSLTFSGIYLSSLRFWSSQDSALPSCGLGRPHLEIPGWDRWCERGTCPQFEGATPALGQCCLYAVVQQYNPQATEWQAWAGKSMGRWAIDSQLNLFLFFQTPVSLKNTVGCKELDMTEQLTLSHLAMHKVHRIWRPEILQCIPWFWLTLWPWGWQPAPLNIRFLVCKQEQWAKLGQDLVHTTNCPTCTRGRHESTVALPTLRKPLLTDWSQHRKGHLFVMLAQNYV